MYIEFMLLLNMVGVSKAERKKEVSCDSHCTHSVSRITSITIITNICCII